MVSRAGKHSNLKDQVFLDMISQSSVIAFFIIAGFVVYITVRGQLPQYAKVIGF